MGRHTTWAAALLLGALPTVAPRPPALLMGAAALGVAEAYRPLLLGALALPGTRAGLFTSYSINVVNDTHAFINASHGEPWWRKRREVIPPAHKDAWRWRRGEPPAPPSSWWDWWRSVPEAPPQRKGAWWRRPAPPQPKKWWRRHDDSILRPPEYWRQREAEESKPGLFRRLQSQMKDATFGADPYKGTTWGVNVGAKTAQNYPIGGLRCYYTVKGGISGGWALSVDDPSHNIAGNNQKAILCPEGQNKFCIRTQVIGLTQTECGWTEYYGDRYEWTPNGEQDCIFKKCASSCKEDKMKLHTEVLEQFREGNAYNRDTLCCKTHYCNAAGGVGSSLVLAGVLGVLLT